MKHSTRMALGPLYSVLMRAKGSSLALRAKTWAGALPYALTMPRNTAPVVDINTPIGMGALLCHTLLLHAHFEQRGVDGHVRATSPLYSVGSEDVLARFFDRPSPPPGQGPMGRWAIEFLVNAVRPDRVPLAEAQRLFAQHFRPGPQLAQALAAATEHDRFDLSIHFRGTDKFLESGQVDFAPMFDAIRRELGERSTARVFLATDDATFAAALRAAMPGLDYTSYDLGEVESGLARHFSNLCPTDKALEALVNIFLIARAPVCVRTSSYMSAVSALANPGMRTVTINQTIGQSPPFPEHEVLERERGQAR